MHLKNLFYITLSTCTFVPLFAIKTKVYNGTNKPITAAVVQIYKDGENQGKLYLEGLKRGNITGVVPVYDIDAYSFGTIDRPGLSMGKDTVLLFSSDRANLTEALQANDVARVNNFVIGQVGNNEVFVAAPSKDIKSLRNVNVVDSNLTLYTNFKDMKSVFGKELENMGLEEASATSEKFPQKPGLWKNGVTRKSVFHLTPSSVEKYLEKEAGKDPRTHGVWKSSFTRALQETLKEAVEKNLSQEKASESIKKATNYKLGITVVGGEKPFSFNPAPTGEAIKIAQKFNEELAWHSRY